MTKATKLPVLSAVMPSAVPLVSCGPCRFLPSCGGMDEQLDIAGCFASCKAERRCDEYEWTCPCRPNYAARWAEVGGYPARQPDFLHACNEPELPPYVPMVITHGLETSQTVSVSTAAITTFELIQGRGARYGVVDQGATELRERLKLPSRCRILLVSVANDRVLAKYWSRRHINDIPQRLAALGVFGITVPNFSFFSDAPRTHTLWNRARMLRCAGEFSSAGLSVVLHLNALTRQDWVFWGELLREHPAHRYVAKEFQTGLLNPSKARAALAELARLQDVIGRDLHPLIIGGQRLLPQLPRYFKRFTLIDSRPWMSTIKRQLYVEQNGRLVEKPHPTESGELLDLLLAQNLDMYKSHVKKQIQTGLNASPPQLFGEISASASA